MGLLFTGAGVLALVACLPVLAVLPRSPEGGEVAAARSARLTLTGPRGRVLLGVVLVAAASGSLGGVYETVWSLLLDSRGATTAQIGLSWTLFALPFVAVVPLGGWLADRIDRRALVLVGMVVASTLAATYPWLHSVAWLLGLGVLEASGVALGTPAAQSLVADAAPAGASGRAQAVYASANTTAMAGGAAAGGALFGVTPWLPFDLVAALGIVLAGLVGWIWRGMSGRVAARPIDELVPADTTLVEAAGIPAGCAG